MVVKSGLNPVQEYWVDAWQRSLLLLDILRERGNQNLQHNAEAVPNVLRFKAELVLDGRSLPRPVNYLLVRIVPPEDAKIGPRKPPFIVVDPRAGHGPGIGGMKQDSEIGVALAAGHACYFIGFLPEPVPGQTIEDVCRAEAAFVAAVGKLHPDADGKPVIIANCQAGWQVMMMAATNPDLMGPIMLAGAPLSYWAGVRGKNPLRYLGGLLGGTWLTALAGDLGDGIFDGAYLVGNFESMNPSNTYWKKAYNVYSKADTEGARFLDFETWWGSPVLLNAEEMQWIADNLFVGNKLSLGEIRTSDGTRIDLRNIKSPIIVFCSWGDDITPPQQALGWITDLYGSDKEIVENGQTIVYTLHQSIGHLGIFVSGKVASKEHQEFAACMDLINLMPPGLYEAVITEVAEDTANPGLIHGRYLFKLEARTLDHIRALGAEEKDNPLFATVARLSEVNLGLYNMFMRPAIRAMATPQTAEMMRALHPNRLRFSMFSDMNPWMAPVKQMAAMARSDRRPATSDNPFSAMETAASDWIVQCLDSYRDMRDAMVEASFLATYGSPLLQALVGLGTESVPPHRRIERDLLRETAQAKMQADLEQRIDLGGIPAAVIRGLIYVRLPEGAVDERGFTVLKALMALQPIDKRLGIQQLKELVRDQYMLLRHDQERAVQGIRRLLPENAQERRQGWKALQHLIAARGELPEEGKRRLNEIEAQFDIKDVKAA